MTAEEWNYTFDKEYPEGVKEPIKKETETDIQFNNRLHDYYVSIGKIKLFVEEKYRKTQVKQT